MSDNPFSPGALQHAVHATLEDAYAAIPEGHTKAFIADGDYTREDGSAVATTNGKEPTLDSRWRGQGSSGFIDHRGYCNEPRED